MTNNSLSLYFHIPFCLKKCDYCAFFSIPNANESQKAAYFEALCRQVSFLPTDREIATVYFGGGTPPLLTVPRLIDLLNRVRLRAPLAQDCEITIEINPKTIDFAGLSALHQAGFNRLSIGIQSADDKVLSALGRIHTFAEAEKCVTDARLAGFTNISVDFIFALPEQTYEDLKADADLAFEIGANHIAIYPFIDFTFTKSKVKALAKKEKRALLDAITNYFESKGYERNSIWTFSNVKEANYSSMTRDNFLGFGCSATTLLKEQFKINTFSVEEYCKRIEAGKLATSLTIRFSLRQRMVYYLFWTAYSTRVDSRDFEKFFGVPLKKMYGFELWLAKLLGFVKEENGIYEMTLKGAFYYHYYENFYTLAYIDKMWGIMRTEAFPERIEL